MKKGIYRRIKILLLLLLPLVSNGQDLEECWLVLSDKQGTALDPITFFDAKAITRRQKNNIPLVTFTDLPVRGDYVRSISGLCDSIVYISRWMNAVIVRASTDQINALNSLPFVKELWLAGPETDGGAAVFEETSDEDTIHPDKLKVAYMRGQTERLGASDFSEAAVFGQGVRVAIFDIGFKSYMTNPGFEHIRKENRIIKTWDFARKKENVDGHHSHGCMVMSCVGGYMPDSSQQIGLATGAEFLLAVTERRTENFKEEVNWLAAAEWADQNGADIINSSLGYTYHRYFRYDMDGKTSFVARAAKMASDKGILVVNSAGNEGYSSWKNVATPADVEEVLSVGGIAPFTGIRSCFSSVGPTWDKRMKPNVCAYGDVVAAGPNGYTNTSGTSFSGPLVAGFAACVMQLHPDWDRQHVFNEIQRSADLYPYFDYAHGYGVPQAAYFIGSPEKSVTASNFQLIDRGNYLEIVLNAGKSDTTQDRGSSKASTTGSSFKTVEPGYIYYHIENDQHYLDKYVVIDTGNSRPPCSWIDLLEEVGDKQDNLKIFKSDFAKPFILRVWFRGQLIEYTCNE